MACDLEKIEETEKEKPSVIIQLNTLRLDELVSLTLKLEDEWKVIKKNYAILEAAVLTYDKCINSVEQLNPGKYKTKNFNSFINELKKSDLINLSTNDNETVENSVTKDVKNDNKTIAVEKSDDLIKENKVEFKEEDSKKNDKQHFDVHIPLTSLVYISGKITNTDNFLVRMGTNYYVERDSEQTIKYFKNKIKRLNEQINKLRFTIIEKKNEIELCKNYIQLRKAESMNSTTGNAQVSVPNNPIQ
ncbi:cochaperone prefoldin complex subunit, putative [Hepatocystis sp. ex Piliocolobus tephrosceles]|nr:cochaperone prefoldin complex subunit, putative [Hepatocystis sp. ex Piliocolobus tephrosceles]